MKTCVSGKKSYPTNEIAEEALIEAQSQYNYGRTTGPVAVYLCEDCGHYHLTSQGQMNDRLAQHLKEGKIQRNREASKWEAKWKRK
jgi:hypothetical protein